MLNKLLIVVLLSAELMWAALDSNFYRPCINYGNHTCMPGFPMHTEGEKRKLESHMNITVQRFINCTLTFCQQNVTQPEQRFVKRHEMCGAVQNATRQCECCFRFVQTVSNTSAKTNLSGHFNCTETPWPAFSGLIKITYPNEKNWFL